MLSPCADISGLECVNDYIPTTMFPFLGIMRSVTLVIISITEDFPQELVISLKWFGKEVFNLV